MSEKTRSYTQGQKRKNKKKPKQNKKKWIGRILLILFLVVSIAFLSGVGLFLFYAKGAPELDVAKLEDTLSSKVYDRNDQLIYEVGEKKRETVAPEQVPFQLKEAIMSIEDKRFEKHIGVDPIRIVGAAISNLTSDSLQGGSTLTQQLIKLSYFSTKEEDQTLKRKAQEASLAIELERSKTKDEILTYYINKVYMSNGLYGMETASEIYFGKSLDQLTLAQTALLAGLPQAPATYDPYVNPDLAKKRRDIVLGEMKRDNRINEEEYQAAINESIEEGLRPLENQSESYRMIDNYIKEVIAEAKEKSEKDIYTDGLEIHTNLDLDAQSYLYNLVNGDEQIQFPNDDFQAAITILDVHTGDVIAQIGGRKVPEDVQLGENLATSAKRDFASAVKPINVYAPAVEFLNYSSARIVVDEPYKYPNTDTNVYNYDRRYLGAITIREALVDSRNVPAAKTIEEVGLDKVSEFLESIDMEYPGGVNPSSAIFGETNSLNMAAAYGALANEGTYHKPSYINRIIYPDGTEEIFKEKGKKVMKDSTAYIVTDMLKDVLKRGTGAQADIPYIFHAGKTGTSNYDEKDMDKIKGDTTGAPNISFVGYNPDYVISVWTGYKDFYRPIPYQEQHLAMLIYKYLMGYLTENTEPKDWVMPDSVVKIGNELYVKDHVRDQTTWKPAPTTAKTKPSTEESKTETTQSEETETTATEPPETSTETEAPTETTPTTEQTQPETTQKPEEKPTESNRDN